MTVISHRMSSSNDNAARRVAQEDLLLFINACFAATSQAEFLTSAGDASLSLDFLHAYILGNHRRVYAQTLAAGINHHNMARIIAGLLMSGRDVVKAHAEEEGMLIAAALRMLPPPRALQALVDVVRAGKTNRRFRAVVRQYLSGRPDPMFDAVKYRRRIRLLSVHAHLRFDDERATFLFSGWKERTYEAPLLETFRQAHYVQSSMYQLPFSVAEGLAHQHGVDRATFLKHIAPRMTAAEKMKHLDSASKHGVNIGAEVSSMSLTKLWLYILSLPLEQRREQHDKLSSALRHVATRTWTRASLRLPPTAVVVDASHSMSGSTDKRRRPLAVALGVRSLVRAAGALMQQDDDDMFVYPHGQTSLATPTLRAMQQGAELIIIVSDGVENDPAGAVNELVRVAKRRVPEAKNMRVIHLNPVYEPGSFSPRNLGASIPTVALRDAEDLPTVLAFARFAAGEATLSELEAALHARAQAMIQRANLPDAADTTQLGDNHR
jgi:hypothetical protein